VSQEPLRVEFRVELGNRRPAPKLEPGAKAERQRQDRAARRARNLALAYWIDGLVRSGEVADLATVARMCGVSRARVTNIVDFAGSTTAEQTQMLLPRRHFSKSS
jgi:hypothetical protein